MLGTHLMYSKAVTRALTAFLDRRVTPVRRDALLARTRQIYLDFLPTVPDLGGRQNFQAQAVYDSIALFAFWEAMEGKLTLEELEQLNNDLFVPQMMGGGLVSFNCAAVRRYAHAIFSHLEKRGKAKNWPGNYHMEVEPWDREGGVKYRFTTCPIADFARAHGYLHLMPALCNADYPMLRGIHAGLIRTTTCANGHFCDYWILGDRDPRLAEHPCYRDEAGYLRNR